MAGGGRAWAGEPLGTAPLPRGGGGSETVPGGAEGQRGVRGRGAVCVGGSGWGDTRCREAAERAAPDRVRGRPRTRGGEVAAGPRR